MNLGTRAAAVAAGLALDHVAGEPPTAIHPVARFGVLMERLETHAYSDERVRGAAYAGAGVAVATAAGGLLPFGAHNRVFGKVVAATAVTVAGRSLADTALAVEEMLEAGRLADAREALPSLVGRDPSQLGEKEIARAVVESVAENTVDAIVAPALWAVAGGAPAAFAYRAVNTLDAMVGHRSARYERFGWASARLDDAAGWVPARVTAALVATVRPRAAASVWRAVREQAPSHPSPNAGVAEAAFAAALGVSVGGTNLYGGRADRRPELGFGPLASAADIGRAVRLSRDVTAALGVALCTPALARSFRRRHRKGQEMRHR